MKKTTLYLSVLFLGTVSICRAETPIELAGLMLGENIEKSEKLLKMDTIIPTRYFESFKEVEIKDIPGFKSGLVYFGTCAAENRIVRIKLKYQDSSMEFFGKLLERYKKSFGQPDDWKGDPFHIVKAWKWSFREKDGKNTSMILQHNTQNPNQKMGNSIKITRYDLLEKEYECFEEKERKEEQRSNNGDDTALEDTDVPDWDGLIPRRGN